MALSSSSAHTFLVGASQLLTSWLLSPPPGERELGGAEGSSPPLRLPVRQAQQGIHALPLGGEGPTEVSPGRQGSEQVRTGVLQVCCGSIRIPVFWRNLGANQAPPVLFTGNFRVQLWN